MRPAARSVLIAGMTGTLMVSAAWAGIGLAPVPTPSLPTGQVGTVGTPAKPTAPKLTTTAAAIDPATLGAGQLLVGAAKNSMNPRPQDMQTRFPGARWETDPDKCTKLAPATVTKLLTETQTEVDHLVAAGSPWPENPSCIYQGGFGIGPMNPVKSFDQTLGLWVRSVAYSDGTQTLVKTVIDGEGWLWDYQNKCTDCGAKQIAAALAADPDLAARGVKPASHILHATHSHASPDFIGGWGFVPNWYMAQITDTIKATAKQAVMTMEAATLEAGEEEARAFNNERRDTYRSAEEGQVSWLRAVAVGAAPASGDSGNGKDQGSGNDPAPTKPRVIATVGAYAAHPTAVGNNGGVAHPDWPGMFEKGVEDRFGGIGLHFMSGLGNMSNSGGVTIGTKLAGLLPEIGGGRPVDDTTVKVTQTLVTSALTNVPLTALGTPGFFDRKFSPTPVVVNTGKNADAPCNSASPQSVELSVTSARIGNDLVFTAAPGEVFANYTNTIKEKNIGRITFPMGQVNDALGYMPQSFELNRAGQQGLGLVAGGYLFVNYEDGYAIDPCVGDLILEATILDLAKVKG